MNTKNIEVSVVMPCLNAEETLGICIEKAQSTLNALGICGEVVIADNGSTADYHTGHRSLHEGLSSVLTTSNL